MEAEKFIPNPRKELLPNVKTLAHLTPEKLFFMMAFPVPDRLLYSALVSCTPLVPFLPLDNVKFIGSMS
jgi:hypothetical protein